MRICPHCEKHTDKEFCPDDGSITVSEEIFNGTTADPLIGRVLNDRYEILGIIGQGGMGAVYRGTQISVQREVAIKVILSDFARDPKNIKRFHREALATSKLTHPNIVYLHDFGQTHDGIPYIVMEYLKGKPLDAILEESRVLPEDRVVSIAAQILKALHHAHGHDVIHRDLKTANVFLVQSRGEQELTKVVDFGIAKILSKGTGQSDITKTGITVGSPAYMSPEQAMNKGVDVRSDLYSLGIILFECLCGAQPYEGETPLEVILKHINEPAPAMPPDDELPYPVSEQMRSLVQMMLEKRKEDRPASAAEALRLLPGYDDADISGAMPRPSTADVTFAGPEKTPQPAAIVPQEEPRTSEVASSLSSAAFNGVGSSDDLSAVLDDDLIPASSGAWRVVIALLFLLLAGGAWAAWQFIGSAEGDPAATDGAGTASPVAAIQAPADVTVEEKAAALVEVVGVEAQVIERRETAAAVELIPEVKASEPEEPKVALSPVLIESVPSDAKVYYGMVPKGTTPFALEAEEGKTYKLRLVRKGYVEAFVTVTGGKDSKRLVTLKKKRSSKPGKRKPKPKPAVKKTPEGPSALDRIIKKAPPSPPRKSKVERL